MDKFTFYRPHDGWIESNIRTFIDHFVVQASSLEILKKHRYRMAKWLYDPRPPPTYPYIRATAAYSATVQWYARSGQLPTAAGMKEKDQGENTRCRMGCDAIEDTHHVFVACKTFDKLRGDACREIVEKTRRKIEAIGLEEAQFTGLLKTAKSLFSDCSVTWPLHYSFYYLGHIRKQTQTRKIHPQYIWRLAHIHHQTRISHMGEGSKGDGQKERCIRQETMRRHFYLVLPNTGPLRHVLTLS